MSTNLTLEEQACRPLALDPGGFNPDASLPYGLTTEHVRAAMQEFLDFLGFVNVQLNSRQIARLEAFLMSANFSSIVGEFMSATIPKHCNTIVKNTYHNGHPDMLPANLFPGNAAQHEEEGIEVKGSRYLKGWQGHNPEDTFLMVFCFDSNTARDASLGIPPKPFRFAKVAAARLEKADWTFAGRSDTSRRTITASINTSGYAKMEDNWIYRAPENQQPASPASEAQADPSDVDLV